LKRLSFSGEAFPGDFNKAAGMVVMVSPEPSVLLPDEE